MINEIRSAFKEALDRLNWMDDHTRQAAKDKVHRQEDRQEDRQMDRQEDRQMDRQEDRQMDRQEDRQVDRQEDRQMDRQEDRQVDGQEDRQVKLVIGLTGSVCPLLGRCDLRHDRFPRIHPGLQRAGRCL